MNTPSRIAAPTPSGAIHVTILRKLIRHFHQDILYRNALYLMLATGVLAAFGFFFWILAARIFSPSDIGLATTLISVMNLISLLSLGGFNLAFVRFLPEAPERDDIINTGMTLVGFSACILAAGFVTLLPFLSPALLFIRTPIGIPLFVLLCAATSLNTLTDAIFLSARVPRYTLIINTIYSACRMFLPFICIGFGAIGIFAAAGFAQALGLALSVYILMKRFDYHPRFAINATFLQTAWHYSALNYAGNVISLAPPIVLPLIIANTLGPAQAGFYYIATMIGNLLYVIPTAATRSLFAEGSNDERTLRNNVRKSVKAIALLLIPTIAIICVGATPLLRIFGTTYASGGASLLRLVALAGIPISYAAIMTAIFQVRKNILAIIAMSCCYAIVTLGMSVLLLPYGLSGIGAALFIGICCSSSLGFIFYKGKYIFAFIDELYQQEQTRLVSKRAYARARALDPCPRAILFYPDLPKPIHILYPICHYLGYDMTTDPDIPHELAITFQDATIRSLDERFQALRVREHFVNADCDDISKEYVEKIFSETFGYGMSIDPRTHHGVCVQKSNENALHDGRVVRCPREPEDGFTYQKLINNQCDDARVYDIRALVFNGTIDRVFIRFRNLSDRFNNTESATLSLPESSLTQEEMRRIQLFCTRIGLEYGELDVLRDKDDGRIYIVDANNTPSGPTPGRHVSNAEYKVFMESMCHAFDAHFLKSRETIPSFLSAITSV